MTPKQRELLDFIESYIAENRFAPSFEEMQAQMGLKSKSGVDRMLAALEEQGQIKRIKNRARAIELCLLGSVPTPVLRAELARREATGAA